MVDFLYLRSQRGNKELFACTLQSHCILSFYSSGKLSAYPHQYTHVHTHVPTYTQGHGGELKAFLTPSNRSSARLQIALRSPQEWGKIFFPRFYSLYHPARLQILYYQSVGKCFRHEGWCWHCAVLLLFCMCCLNWDVFGKLGGSRNISIICHTGWGKQVPTKRQNNTEMLRTLFCLGPCFLPRLENHSISPLWRKLKSTRFHERIFLHF